MAVSVIIPAYQAAARIAETVRAARGLSGVGEVIVVDDGSRDGTTEAARAAGSDHVITLPRNQGKGAALTTGITAASGDRLLFLDADLGGTAEKAEPLLGPVTATGAPVMTIATFPRTASPAGFGLGVLLAKACIRLLTGLTMRAPLSGQRALPAALARHLGIAPRFGVEVALTIEATHAGAQVQEIELPLEHARTGRSWRGFLHRGRQCWDILRYFLPMVYGRSWPALTSLAQRFRILIIDAAILALLGIAANQTPSAVAAMSLALVASIALWLPILWWSSVTLGIRKPNYLGRSLPGAAGLLFPFVWLLTVHSFALSPQLLLAGAITVTGFSALGLMDDLFGARHQARGLRGHLRALLQGRLTTGAVKAIGGIVIAFISAWIVAKGELSLVLVDGLLIALCANTVNLLDLRPGRALKGFTLLAAIALICAPETIRLLGPLLAAALIMAPPDLAGRTMMGDTGSNTLGAAVGLALALALPWWGRITAIVFLIAFHIVCERYSLTRLIAGHRFFAALDRLGTTHLPPFRPEGGEAA